MEQPKYLISPRVAIATLVAAGLALTAAIIAREDAPSAPTVREVARPAEATPPAPDRPVPPLLPPADDAIVLPSVPPKIEGVKARAQLATLGVDLQLDVAVSLAAVPHDKESVSIKASCKLDGEWYSGTAYLRLSKLAAGTTVMQHKVALGRQHAFTELPTQCQLGFEYSSYAQRPSRREWIARMCWDGSTVTDQPCTVAPNKSVAVSAVRVQTSLDRYRMRQVGSPVDLEVALDATLARPLADWQIEIAADCTLPDGTTHKTAERVWTHDVHAGRPFTGKTLLFRRGQQMIDVPTACTVAVEVADRQRLVREPVAAYCWRDGAVTTGACAA